MHFTGKKSDKARSKIFSKKTDESDFDVKLALLVNEGPKYFRATFYRFDTTWSTWSSKLIHILWLVSTLCFVPKYIALGPLTCTW